MNIALLGPSGAGKGSHADTLCTRYRLRHVATGDLFRSNVAQRTVLGRIAQQYMSLGELVPDMVVDAMVEEWGDSLAPEEGMLFDGFPRTIDQAAFLDRLLQRLERELDALVYLRVSDAEIVRRLSGRLVCPKCQTPFHAIFNPSKDGRTCDRCGGDLMSRPDDTVDLVQTRLRVFHRAVQPVLERYAAARKLVIVSGEGAIDMVERALLTAFYAIRDESIRFATMDEAVALAPARPIVAPPAASGTRALALVLLGGPGSGKGTQAAGLSATLRLPHIATSDLFRENLRRGTALGQLAKGCMERGELVPDDVTDAIVEERLARADTQPGFILDGFPRTLAQAEALDDMLARQHRRLTAALFIDVSDAVIIERISGRMVCRDCQSTYHVHFHPAKVEGVCDKCGGRLYLRPDDAAATVGVRLSTFHRQTEPLIAYYRNAGILRDINGEGDSREIAARCQAVVRALSEKFTRWWEPVPRAGLAERTAHV